MIDVQELTRCYGRVPAVDSVSFQIEEREVVGLLGHNGAGKTTMMRMLSGYLEPSSGRILFHGEDIAQSPLRLQQRLGYLPENLPLYQDMVVADYLEFEATLRGIPRRRRDASVREVILATDLVAVALDKIDTLSRGYKQRVGVAQALLGRPSLLILDEPTNGLDPAQTHQMRSLIRRLSRNATVILSTHVMQEVDATCDRVLVLRNGQLALDATLGELKQSNRRLQLRTDKIAVGLENRLKRLPSVEGVTALPGADDYSEFHVQLSSSADLESASSDIALCVVEVGAKLYELRSESRGLEDVFREVNHDAN
ncbi:MAG: ATP-binding cassette domain-containing protein [Pseudomonadota bacterium]